MRVFIPLFGLAALVTAASLSAGSASASASASLAVQPEARPGVRAVLICTNDAATRRAFTREHGAAPVFVSARDALSVRPSDPAWTAPRCMTAREHAHYQDAISSPRTSESAHRSNRPTIDQ